MYNFKMMKTEQNKICEECNLSEIEKFIFNNLAEGKSRLSIFDLAKEKYNISQSTVNRTIKKLVKIVSEYKNDESIFSHKVYIHKFPNGKKYVGVCQCCEDRWANGKGYAYNKEMYEDIQKYGWNNIEHKILIEIKDSKIAYDVERILIEELDLINNGYNNQ